MYQCTQQAFAVNSRVVASIDGRNYLVIDTTIYSTDLSCLFGIPQLQPFFFVYFQRLADQIPMFMCSKNCVLKNHCKEEKQLKVAGDDNPRRHGNERE